jgi:ribosomal protein S12 methylthiotransferase accessory factor
VIASAAGGVPARWLPFLGAKLGVVRGLYDLATDPDDPALHHVLPTATSLGRLLGRSEAPDLHAGGAGTTLADAVNRAMGELLERYACFADDGGDRIVGTYEELRREGRRLAPIEYLGLFSRHQFAADGFPYAEFTASTRVGWLEGTNLLDGLPTYVPGQSVALGYRHGPEEIPPCFYPTSSGCAVATSVEEAIVKGLLEVVERDAVMIRWYARMAPPALKVDPEAVTGGGCGLLPRGLEIRFHDLTVDGTHPVVGVTCVERSGRPCFFILGAAAALDVTTAARKALIEAGQGRPFVKSMAATTPAPPEDSTFNDFHLNLRFFAEPSNARYVEWFFRNCGASGREWPAPAAPTPCESLSILLAWCAESGVTPVAFDMTTRELRDAGLYACRVVVPELVPLCVPAAPFLGHPRLAHFMAAHAADRDSAGIPEWVPHPFP